MKFFDLHCEVVGMMQPASGLKVIYGQTRGSAFVATRGLNDETPLAFWMPDLRRSAEGSYEWTDVKLCFELRDILGHSFPSFRLGRNEKAVDATNRGPANLHA